MTSPDAQLLARFVSAFKRGLDREIAAMSGVAETFEYTLANGEDVGSLRYGFDVADAGGKLAVGGECSLRTSRGELRVTIDRVDERRITVASHQPIDLAALPITLVVAPWFIYERLLGALDDLDLERYSVPLALTVFGKRPHRRVVASLRRDHDDLNASQRAAVQLCSESDLAFVWGPPGTGKTVTLAHVIEELLAQDKRILLVSTTNAAIDQTLAKMASQPWFAGAVEAGTVVRLGRSEDETFGAEIADAVERSQGSHRRALDHLRARVAEAERQTRQGEWLLAGLTTATAPQQSLFAAPPARLSPAALSGLFPQGLAEVISAWRPQEQEAAVHQRLARLARLRTLAKARIAHHTTALRDTEERVVGDARVVMCTLTHAYLSPLMKHQRFDVLIAEEAGMAALPPLFYAACLCREKAILVGDPRQLPPIVHSREALVQRAIGRSVFEVAVPDPARSDIVAMLDIQYRMHPVIGSLVGRLFYDGRLTHGAELARKDAIAARAPYPGKPLIVVDTASLTTCQRSAKGSSRVNPVSADLTARLAFDAVAESAESIAVITPYAAQAHEIRRRLAARKLSGSVECSTIHRFQGRECDVVIIDLVDAAPMRPGVLLAGGKTHSDACHLLNVSISRARGKLVIVADVGYFEEHAADGIVATILREAARDGARVRLESLPAAS